MRSKIFLLLFITPIIFAESGDYEDDTEMSEAARGGMPDYSEGNGTDYSESISESISDDEDFSEGPSGDILLIEDVGEDVYVDENSEEIIVEKDVVDVIDENGNEEIETETDIIIENPTESKAHSGPDFRNGPDVEVTESASDSVWYEQKHLLAALIAGAAAGVLFATLVVILCIHRIRKKDEGSYSIDNDTKYHAGFKSSSGEKRDCEVFA